MGRALWRVAVVLLTAMLLPGCAGKTALETAPESLTASAPAEAEVKPAPVVEPAAAVPPPVAPVPAAPATGSLRPASPDEQTKETLGPKPARIAALAPAAVPAAKKSAETGQAAKPAAQAKAPDRCIAVVGDSLAVGIGMTMEQNLKQYAGMGCHPLGKISTGLISRRFFDWEKRLTELLATEKVTAVVVMMGGNDANNAIGGKMAGTPEWGAAYRQKAESFLRIASGAGIKVLWVGLPAMRDPAFSARVRAVNAAAKEACRAVPGCVYMEASDTFVDASGNYVQAKDIGGRNVSLRAKDGVHMTMTGYDLLCRQVLDRLQQTGELVPR